MKCNGKLPCGTCTDKGYDCHYRKQDGAGESQEGSGLPTDQPEINAQAPLNILGGLSTPASSHDMSSVNLAPDAANYESVAERDPLPTLNQGLTDPEGWNFDWMMDMEMNDFSVGNFEYLNSIKY